MLRDGDDDDGGDAGDDDNDDYNADQDQFSDWFRTSNQLLCTCAIIFLEEVNFLS